MKKIDTRRLATVAVLIAIEVVLSRFCSIQTPIVKIGFGFIPMAVVAILYGPLWAGVAYGVSDFLGATLFPIGPYFPGFTLTSMLTGVLFGLLLHKKQEGVWPAVVAATLNNLVLGLLLNSYWLSILWGNAFIALLPTRIVQCAVMIPLQAVAILLLQKKLCPRLRPICSWS